MVQMKKTLTKWWQEKSEMLIQKRNRHLVVMSVLFSEQVTPMVNVYGKKFNGV